MIGLRPAVVHNFSVYFSVTHSSHIYCVINIYTLRCQVYKLRKSYHIPGNFSQWPCGLRCWHWSLGRWDRGLESRLRHGCLSSSIHHHHHYQLLVALSLILYSLQRLKMNYQTLSLKIRTEIVTDTTVICNKLTQLIAWEDFTNVSHCESVRSYITKNMFSL
jgi:hypothetical protein